MSRLRIAWLCPYLPAPTNSGGRIRIARMARSLASHELVLFARLSRDDAAPGEDTRAALAQFADVHTAPLLPVRRPAPTPVTPRSFPRALWHEVEQADQRQPFDAVVIEHCYSMYWLKPLRRAVTILNEHNVESDYWLGEFRRTKNPMFLVDHLRWRAFERRCWRRVDAVTAVTPVDARRIESVRGQCLLIGNGVAPEDYDVVLPSRRAGLGVLFVGTMSYGPNMAAATELARSVLPRVHKRFPGAYLTIAGRDPSPSLRGIASEHVRITGTVDSLKSLFNEHVVYANPVSYGAGSSLKILEPLSAGLPLVAGEFAARGHGLVAGQHYLAAQDAQSMADAIIRVLAEREAFDEMAVCARAFVTRHSWDRLTKPFVELVERLAAGRAMT